jgi:predicted ABC-type transport system involved in lysophospholipase L1 biosynthesis ATPase subunit
LLHAGESVSIRGESGAGKSTLLHLLAGLDSPDEGELFWNGARIDARRCTAVRNRFLGLIFQSFHLVPELTAEDNVLLPRRIGGRVDAAARRRAVGLLARVGLDERAAHLPSQLSGGERQRVAVARALMNQPSLLLADEPTGNLDERTGESVITLLLELVAETQTALILVTHNPAHAARTSRQMTLSEGILHHG